MNYLVVGGSKNIGYLTSVRLLESGNTVTFLLRKLSVFETDETIQKYVKSGHVRLVQGDALSRDDVARAWQKAAEGETGLVEGVVFSVGGIPSFKLTKGFVQTPANLVTLCLLNVLATWPHAMAKQPKLVVVTSNGLSKETHNALPFLLRLMYSYLLAQPHEDKLGVERAVYQAAGKEWKEREPNQEVLHSGWKSLLREGAWLPDTVIVRPALFTDGECLADAPKPKLYRTSDGVLPSAWTISRKDTAHFIATKVLADWNSWKGKEIVIAY
ncbi:hypothetical protein SISNIDRAFT_545910 [Sistotremastrum niveocremeum HHB9708]|uniref:NAD(P)-binding domain-containing protein n=1 Tax=Sistotremastrum niveocremeum HHB9708 TaxID=1314777 RepID=A0A165AJ37_9AGAM|nr:hypothetical protein SISNIDRAFT_545910 [Sistotremastrum niveocremeum HHB9708]